MQPHAAPSSVAHRRLSGDCAQLLLDTLRFYPEPNCAELRRRWSRVATDDMYPLVQHEGCLLWLYRRLVDLEILDVLGNEFRADLSDGARRVAARNLLVDAQRDAVIRTLDALEIPHVLLKGAALRLIGDHIPYADARPTADVDILIPVDWMDGAWEGLREAGFEVATNNEDAYEGHHHIAPLSDRLGISVELHRSTSGAVAPRDAWTRMASNATEVAHENRSSFVPCETELLWHALTHAVALGPHGFRLRFFQDAAVIMGAGETLDWETLRGRLESRETSAPLLAQAWLVAAAALAGKPTLPAWLSRGGGFDLHRALAWRARITARVHSHDDHREYDEPAIRSSRLLIEEGTRADLGLGLTPPRWGKSALSRVGRRFAAGAARVTYLGWRSLNR